MSAVRPWGKILETFPGDILGTLCKTYLVHELSLDWLEVVCLFPYNWTWTWLIINAYGSITLKDSICTFPPLVANISCVY